MGREGSSYEPLASKPPPEAVIKGDVGGDLGVVLVGEANTEDRAVMLRRAMNQGEREGIDGGRSSTDRRVQCTVR